MKKISIVMALAIAVLSATTAYADFSLHGGVTFDMSADEMIAAESSNGLSPQKITDGTISLATEWGANHTYDFSEYSSVYEVTGSFINDSFKTIYYFFDKEDKLCQMIYAGTSCYQSDYNIENINDALAKLYKEKYGDPQTVPVDIPNISDMQDLPSLKVEDTGYIVYELSLTNSCYQWLYPYDDTNAANIEIQGLKWVMKGRDQTKEYPAYSPIVGYTRVSLDDVSAALQGKEDQAAQAMDDI